MESEIWRVRVGELAIFRFFSSNIFSAQVDNEIRAVDAMLLYLRQRLRAENLHKRTDIIVLSDHGMLTVTPANFIDLYQFVGRAEANVYGTSPVLQVVAAQPSRQVAICDKLKEAGKRDGRFTAYDIDSLPDRWRIKNVRRFGPCVVVADPPWAFHDYYGVQEWFPDVDSKCFCFCRCK